ncbi:MAG: GNAT family N-acetyltransferase [Clostridia bacterium]|nr:GNAT family N-acetyltransferase [Clostridia bacterium]
MKFKYEIPTIERKKDALEFINEFYEYNSSINGVGGLNRYVNDYEGWLEKVQNDCKIEVSEERVPARTYFLVRVDDNRIIGMTNIRLKLNKKLMESGRNIGYSIRPTERGNGYNKINLYLALKVCKRYGIKTALLDADEDNPASWRTMESLGGVLDEKRESVDDKEVIVRLYSIDVEKSIDKYKDLYENMVEKQSHEYIGEMINVKIDRPMNSKHPKYDFIYPVNYGFVPDTISGDGEELDCYVLGIDKPLNNFKGECIAVIHRTNDNDDKLVIANKGDRFSDEEIKKLTHFQEQYFESEIWR